MNKENINRLYQLMIEDDEMLMGSQWEEMCYNEYDTPKSILNNFMDIYLATNFVAVDDDLKTTPLANQEEKIMAMVKYLEKIINDLKNRIQSENNVNDWGGRMTYAEIREISSRFESFDEQIEEATLDTANMREEPEFWYYEARINIKTNNDVIEVARMVINEDPEEGNVCAFKNKLYGLTFEQRVEQERAYNVCKDVIKDYLNDSLIK